MTASKSKTLEELDGYFSFAYEGKTYVMPLKTNDVMTPGWVRQNRRRSDADYLMTLMEALCADDGGDHSPDDVKHGEEIMAVLDGMPWEAHKTVQKSLLDHVGTTLGE